MSGHSKWSTIKRKKGVLDAKRGKIFTKLIREITVAAKMGGGDPDGNPRLRMAIQNAKGANMPQDNVNRAITKGTGDMEGVIYEEFTYEGYGPGGVAILIPVLTENRNRTGSEVRHILSKRGGNLSEPNAVAWNFEKKGIFLILGEGLDEDNLMEVVLEAGAEDMEPADGNYEVRSEPESYEDVRAALEKNEIAVESAELAMLPKTTVQLEGKPAEQMLRLIEALEDNDDVQNVWANFDISEEEMEKISA
ncbi:MAG: YebC/PmpR family DNA-binding transcriptional regulator [Nitrospinaceae bacterium]|jgi:YebC/PmpR family DNA-binding regulatory protein|nr:YebC/PmpR family DNA-binding transcriptional regulator [Nitrospinaceae bacterium]MBT3435453.1 YebC/PmpR family DNA-binding transcriptional regulator [Nitrospinaceae bacterium]MBT3821314.1 YebC/PmpR family DNA-binding transcriptional regulator [Nitrospinaceae bacterium]MBT4094053.1 YebC/PmpR family DNA-binding transcriptional regulator [Nitrospinaceae bacterium]MBT4431821.1 YebC/PmpR family DNA-binding transcriptional regulator [Nitrospinaceae bacterium]